MWGVLDGFDYSFSSVEMPFLCFAPSFVTQPHFILTLEERPGISEVGSMNVRNAKAGDRKSILDLTLASYEEYSTVMSYWEHYRENIIATLAGAEEHNQIVAEEDGRIVGAVLLYPAGGVFSSPDEETITLQWPEVRLLAVAPDARRRGVGFALMAECVRRARASGARFLTLHTNDLMRSAIRLYENMGFKRYPELDFVVDEKVVVKGYRLDLRETGR